MSAAGLAVTGLLELALVIWASAAFAGIESYRKLVGHGLTSNIAVGVAGALAGLLLVAAGFNWGDPIAGFAVTLFILRVGWEVTREMLHHLMDGLDAEHLEAAAVRAAVEETRAVRWSASGAPVGD